MSYDLSLLQTSAHSGTKVRHVDSFVLNININMSSGSETVRACRRILRELRKIDTKVESVSVLAD